jgi:serine/threonine protein kinase
MSVGGAAGGGSGMANWVTRLRLALDVSRAVEHLHSFSPPLLHRDIKSHNVLLDGNGTGKLCDFGEARGLRVGAAATPMTGNKVEKVVIN